MNGYGGHTINGVPVKSKLVNGYDRPEPKPELKINDMGWGTIKIGSEEWLLVQLLQGWEGRMKPAETAAVFTLLHEYKRRSVELSHAKDEFAEAVRRVDNLQKAIKEEQSYLNTIEESIDKLMTPELLNILLDKGVQHGS